MPPKRKAPADVVDAANDSGLTSPTPRKRTKAEAKAAAKEWHDNRVKKAAAAAAAASSSASVSTISASVTSEVSSAQKVPAVAIASGNVVNVGITATAKGATSPTPRKKSKAEARAAAKAWHENRSGRTGTTGASLSPPRPPPSIDGNLTTDKSTTRGTGGNAFLKSVRTEASTATVMKPKKEDPPPSPGVDTNKSARGAGGNAFLKSVRAEAKTSAVVEPKKEDPPTAAATGSTSEKPEPESTAPASSNEGSATTASSVVTPAQPKSTPKSFIGKVLRFVFFVLGLTLNVAVIFGIINHQSSSFDEFERQNDVEVSRLTALISKSSELEAVLRSGVRVLEEKVQKMREAMGVGGEGDGHALQEMQSDEDDVELLMSEDKQNMLDALQTLEEQLGAEQL